MADETTQFILGDAAADALDQPRKRRFFGKRKKAVEKLTNCENCGTALTGEYCANCGQHAIDYRRSLFRVLLDALDSFLNWDTKFLKSVGILITRPWRLTNDFNAGRRVRYVHPLRLYLLASIAFFLLAKLINFTPSGEPDLTAEDRAELDAELSKLTAPNSALAPDKRALIEELRKRFASDPASLPTEERARIEKAVTKLSRFGDEKELSPKDLTKLDAVLSKFAGNPAPATEAPPESGRSVDALGPPAPIASATPKKNSVIIFDNEGNDGSPFGIWLEKRVKEKVGEDGTKAELFLDTLRSNVPTMMLFCVPLFAFVLKILYMLHRRYYVEHLVYSLHIHTFAYLATVLITLISLGLERMAPSVEAPRVLLVVALSLAAAVLVFLSIRRVYKQGWFMTTFKFLLGGFAYFVILIIAVGTTAFVTLLLP